MKKNVDKQNSVCLSKKENPNKQKQTKPPGELARTLIH